MRQWEMAMGSRNVTPGVNRDGLRVREERKGVRNRCEMDFIKF